MFRPSRPFRAGRAIARLPKRSMLSVSVLNLISSLPPQGIQFRVALGVRTFRQSDEPHLDGAFLRKYKTKTRLYNEYFTKWSHR